MYASDGRNDFGIRSLDLMRRKFLADVAEGHSISGIVEIAEFFCGTGFASMLQRGNWRDRCG
jgi:hypothetical protein